MYRGLPAALFSGFVLFALTAYAQPAKTTVFFVNARAAANGDGSREHPFVRITDALDRARAIRRDSAAPIDIQVGPGVYVGSYTNTGSTTELLPIRLDVSHLKLIGTTKMENDEGGLPTGVIKSNSNTLLLADPPLEGMQSILALSSPNVTVENLSFNAGSGHGGWVVRVDHVQGFTLVNNYVTGGNTDSAMGIHVSRSSGKILSNYVMRGGCGICIVADDVSSPAEVAIIGNRSVRNEEGGLALIGGPNSPPGSLSAVVCANDLSDNNSQPNSRNANFFSFGLRLFLLSNIDHRNEISGSVKAAVCNNRITNNSAGIVIDAGFAFRTRNSTFDPRRYTGRFELTFANNQIRQNTRTPALMSFTRFTASNTPTQLNPVGNAQSFKYVESSFYNIIYFNGELDGYWFDNPETDPVDGRLLNNVLRINGNEIHSGRFIPYSH
jgi:hypothetical protein